MMASTLVKGWCPGALRPMESGDGLLVRLRITGGVLSAKNAHIIAKASMQHGNGLIDLSSRANLQLRGVGDTNWPHLISELSRHGLIDQDPEAEAVRNVIASPLAGHNPTALIDIQPVVSALESRLIEDRALHALPGKFGFLVDDGGTFGVAGQTADIAFEAEKYGDEILFNVRLGDAETVALVAPEQIPNAAAALALAFLHASKNRDTPFKRMVDCVNEIGCNGLFETAGLKRLGQRTQRISVSSPLGWHSVGDFSFLGIGAPFGRWSANSLSALANIAAKYGKNELRLTPWRIILIPGLNQSAAKLAIKDAGPNYITNADDNRLRVAACPGKPACKNATVYTHDDALALADLGALRGPSVIRLHVSGCEKGCALPTSTKIVLVGRNGLYDLVLNGKASDAPIQSGMNLRAAEAAIERVLEGAKG
jgi:precorrin-3B synthase